METDPSIVKALECEALARLCSYGRDKERLLAEAARWREEASKPSLRPALFPRRKPPLFRGMGL